VKTVIVAGAAGGIGRGIVGALLGSGEVRVIATSRTEERLAELRAGFDSQAQSRMLTIRGDAGNFASAEDIVAQVRALGGADAAIASLGRGFWSSGPILDLAPGEWRSVLDEMLTSHFAFARAAIPLLRERAGSTYLALGGGAAYAPVPGAGLMSIAAAGQLMLTRVLAAESSGTGPRILELVVNGPANTPESRNVAGAKWMTDGDIGTVAADLVLRGSTSWPSLRTNGPLLIMDEAPAQPLSKTPDTTDDGR
jgi:NAD(P)-dependent dehydrogenase (short-subunit alcohol dehydrogenase family)